MSSTTSPISTRSRAFGEGADARLYGWPETANPYDFDGKNGDRQHWADGWRSVHLNWGKGVKGRWRVRPLPRVKT